MRRSVVPCLLLMLVVAHSAEAARISFATQDCGTPPLLGLTFTIDASGQSILLDPANACPGELAIPGDLVGDDGTPFYGTSITSLDLTISSGQLLEGADFLVGDYFGDSSLGFSFDFAPSSLGGGVLSVLFTAPVEIPCTLNTAGGASCRNVDLLLFIEGDRRPLIEGSLIQVTEVNGASVPEPGTLALLGLGAATLAVRHRRATSKKL